MRNSGTPEPDDLDRVTTRRDRADVLRLAGAGGVLAACIAIADRTDVGDFQVDLFRLINGLPESAGPPLTGIMQFGALGMVPVAAAITLLLRRRRLAASIVVVGVAAWGAAKGLQQLFDIEPPQRLLRGVTLRGSTDFGLAFPATHTAVATALAAVSAPYLRRNGRHLAWAAVVLVGVARVYVGAHLPIDVLAGFAVGAMAADLWHVALGRPLTLPTAGNILAGLRRAGLPATELEPMAGGTQHSAWFTAPAGWSRYAVHVVYRDAGPRWLDQAWRLVAYRRDDRRSAGDASNRAEHEAYLTLLADRAGVAVPEVVASADLSGGHAVVAYRHVDGIPLGAGGPSLADGVLPRVWAEVGRLHRADIAHRSLVPHNVLVDSSGRPTLTVLGRGRAPAAADDKAADVATLLVSTAQIVGPEAAVAAATAGLGAEAVVAALPALQPLALPRQVTGGLRSRGPKAPIGEIRRLVADLGGVEAGSVEQPMKVAAKNLLPLAFLALAVYLLLPQIAKEGQTATAIEHAHWEWTPWVLAAAAGTYAAAALALMGASPKPLVFGRTFVVQVAAAFTNRVAPGGVGGMLTNVRYLESAGVTRTSGGAVVALNSLAGFIVHALALVTVLPMLGTGSEPVRLRAPDLKEPWPVLIFVLIGVLVAAGLTRRGAQLRGRAAGAIKQAGRDLAAVLRRPRQALELFGGSAALTFCYAVALVFSVEAFGGGVGVAHVMGVYLAGAAAAAAAPTPGGLGALEAALVAGLTAIGLDSGSAVAAVVLYRLITYWFPVLPGAVAYRFLRKADVF